MEFWKMNGAGNDFLIVDNMNGAIKEEQWPVIAKLLCERHLSIGADGFMVVEPSESADYKMKFYNADGTMGEMCGNGARCIARYGYERGLAGETQVIETTAGIVTGQRIDQRLYKIRLNDPSIVDLERKASVFDGDMQVDCAYVELGDPGIPHAVVPIFDLKNVSDHELFELGRELRYSKAFPKGVNVNFYQVLGEDHVYERTYERGVEDFTYACGTGTGSMVLVLTMTGQVSGKGVKVDMRGGQLIIDIERDGDKVTDIYLTGPTNIVAKGQVTDEDLVL